MRDIKVYMSIYIYGCQKFGAKELIQNGNTRAIVMIDVKSL